MSTLAFEAFLARLYVEPALRERVVVDPERTGLAEGLTELEAHGLQNLDLVGLELAARSFERKRARQHAAPGFFGRAGRSVRGLLCAARAWVNGI